MQVFEVYDKELMLICLTLFRKYLTESAINNKRVAQSKNLLQSRNMVPAKV